MDKTQTAQTAEDEAAPREERTERHLRVLAELAEIQMAVARATQVEAFRQAAPRIDYCARIATVSRSVRLTLLLEEEMARPPEERAARAKARPAPPGANWREKPAGLGVAAVAVESAEREDVDRLRAETVERLERPERLEAVEQVERCPAPKARPVAVSRRDWHLERVTLAVVAAVDDANGSGSEKSHSRCAEAFKRLERPEVVTMIECSPAPEAVARLCREWGLPVEVDRWLGISDGMLEEMELIPKPPPAAPGSKPEAPDTG
ncbi:hypothetical protein [Inquilinus sp.]|jgi:hypothetical protein|uniref:hypothetical protein n=1 Tax=Inquilinus sp. TaxID=1932117 RepID=UPI0037846C9C